MAPAICGLNPCAIAKCFPITPCNSGYSPTKSETKSALHIEAAISVSPLLDPIISAIKDASCLTLCVLSYKDPRSL